MRSETDRAIQRAFGFRGRNRNLPWYPRRGTRHDLAQLFGAIGLNRGVEVGTRRGSFAFVLTEGNTKLSLTCVDPYAAYNSVTQERQDENLAIAQRSLAGKNVTFLRRPSLDAVHEFDDGSLDFVYIDGDHAFDMAIQDIIAWSAKVRSGGIVAVHDYHPWVGKDVIEAVDAYTHCHGINPWYVTREIEPTAFWVKR